MTQPRAATPPASARRSHRDERAGVDAVRFAALLQLAVAAPELAHVGTRSLQRRVRAFLVAELQVDLVPYLLSYADPTGERAVHNVMRAAR